MWGHQPRGRNGGVRVAGRKENDLYHYKLDNDSIGGAKGLQELIEHSHDCPLGRERIQMRRKKC